LRLSGERSEAERVRCNRGFGESLLMSRNMTGQYAWAEVLFNGPELASERKPLSRKDRALLRRDLCRRRPGGNGSTMRVRAVPRVIACPAPHLSRLSTDGLRLSGERRSEAQARVLQRRVRRRPVQTGYMVYRFDRGHG
jgi:hypothetical protein